jgi:hypothetical protein
MIDLILRNNGLVEEKIGVRLKEEYQNLYDNLYDTLFKQLSKRFVSKSKPTSNMNSKLESFTSKSAYKTTKYEPVRPSAVRGRDNMLPACHKVIDLNKSSTTINRNSIVKDYIYTNFENKINENKMSIRSLDSPLMKKPFATVFKVTNKINILAVLCR